ncbi:MAG TPA: Stk1 family PASTA domain-containing Ser/Thr kinase [Microlunatus sp.]
MTSDQNVVGGRYELGDILGRGGMAEVRRAVDTRLGRQVAVKQLRTDLATDPTFQARFRREAQSAAGLNHPTIVAVYDTGEETDPVTGISIPYIVMELVEGQTLREVLRDGRKILPERALELTQGVLDALSYSHKAGIVHRDIKPANVMLTGNGSVKVMDFGIARAVADTSATMTQTAAVIGTAQYLSPEQARGETVDARSDVYSAGCLLYELLVGRPPFVGESPVSVAYQHVREAPVPPSQLDSMITPEVDAITLKALAKDPDDRYQSAREMKADISRVLAGEQSTAMVPAVAEENVATRVVAPVPAPVPEPEPLAEEEPKRRVGLAVLIGALIVALLAGGGYALYRVLQPTTPPAPALIAVPNVVTYNETQAKDRLTDVGLVARVVDENGSEDTKDQVTKQNPVPGAEVAGNSTVTITVNKGPKTGTIPDNLIGRKRSAVKDRLDEAGFTNVSYDAATSEPIESEKDEVLTVTPDQGSTAALDDKITVTYATGKSPVPNLVNRTQGQAEDDAEAMGFNTDTDTVVSDQPAGIVIRQKPTAGTKLDRGDSITIVVAKAKPTPPPTTPPVTPPPDSPSPSDTDSPSASPSPSPSPGGGGGQGTGGGDDENENEGSENGEGDDDG